jgi:PncC family amidohydrolase
MFFSHARFVVWIEKKRNEMAEDNLVELARQLGILLQKHDLVLATAESLTGGFISQAVTSVPGSSAWFDRGFVVYNDEAKKSMLHVSEKTLKEHTAVSSVVARQMAHGALSNSKATIAVAVTGVAGPTGGTPTGGVQPSGGTRRVVHAIAGTPADSGGHRILFHGLQEEYFLLQGPKRKVGFQIGKGRCPE